ncbi:hypothetical protein H6G74_13835 [Nostoc spongiaeforme FACHB-130]|uniref:SH3b domain-containing protein n=2 Tax=Nostoc TaxID=1177 RepID=A0ABR8FVK3_9NOSO|nr:hypothetical protein [Nostoc spongiaeforme FACHB-130]
MMNDTTGKDKWDKIQVIFTIITALTTGIWGAFIHFSQQQSNKIQSQINQTQQDISNRLAVLDRTIKSVDSMSPYIDRISENGNKAKSKLAAYAIYLLNKDDPQMAVSLILAADKVELYDVLKDLGKRDPKILIYISEALPKPEKDSQAQEKTSAIKSTENVVKAIQTATSGWCYVGNFHNNRWSRKTIQVPENAMPQEGNTYTIIDDVYLREKQPEPPNYTLGNVTRVNKVGEKVKIEQVAKIPGKDWVWARVTIMPK